QEEPGCRVEYHWAGCCSSVAGDECLSLKDLTREHAALLHRQLAIRRLFCRAAPMTTAASLGRGFITCPHAGWWMITAASPYPGSGGSRGAVSRMTIAASPVPISVALCAPIITRAARVVFPRQPPA